MTDQQENLLKLFKEIDAICKKHNIMYFLAGGTAIGAVRHHGFIPWDDDMDLYMTRTNWLKFVEVSKTDFPEGRCLLCQELDHSYTNMFGRYCDSTVTAIHRHSMYQTEKSGEVIDILTLDPVPHEPEIYKKYVENIMLYSELINTTAPLYGYRWNIKASRYLRYWFLSKIIGRDRVLEKLENKLFVYKEEDCDYYAMRWGGAPFLFPKQWFDGKRTCQFEDGEYYIPYMNHAYLTWHYGDDWFYIPNHEERESHNTVSRLDMGSDEFRNHYNVFINSSKRKWYIELLGMYRKAYYMRTAKKREYILTGILKDKAGLIAEDLKLRLERSQKNPLELAYNREFETLETIYGEYTKHQLSRDFIGREDFMGIKRFNSPCWIPISDEQLLPVLYMYLYKNKIAQALRVLEIRETQEGYHREKFKEIYYFIEQYRKASNLYDMNSYQEAYEILELLLQEYPENPTLMKFIIRLTFNKKMGSISKAKELTKQARLLFPEDGDFFYYDIRYVNIISDREELLDKFQQIQEMTNNGMVLLEIEEFN